MATPITPKVQVVLRKPRPVTAIIALAQAIEAAMSAHTTTFPSPSVSMAQFTSDISALVVAQSATAARTKGAAQTRDAKLAVVDSDLGLLRNYVEGIAQADPANASPIALSAGMDVRKPRTAAPKNDVNAKTTTVSGTIVVSARVGTKQKQSHEWQYSTDGGKTWTAATSTTQAKTTITGLTPGVTVLVRHRAITRTGPTNWTDPASVVVV
jgi:hypothetical protein